MGVDNRAYFPDAKRVTTHPDQEGKEPNQPGQSQETEKQDPQGVINKIHDQILEIAKKVEDVQASGILGIDPSLRQRSSEYKEARELLEKLKKEVLVLIKEALPVIQQVEDEKERTSLAWQILGAVSALQQRTGLMGIVADMNLIRRRVMSETLQKE